MREKGVGWVGVDRWYCSSCDIGLWGFIGLP